MSDLKNTSLSYIGSLYVRGPQGPQGIRGLQGLRGLQGSQGIEGEIGPSGGPQGEQGVQGAQGLQGLPGEVGPTGNTGDQGPQGETGSQGPQGARGSQGPQGYRGLQGNQGQTGSTGVQGLQGPQGLQGNQGTQGNSGTQGYQGAQGNQGRIGVTGAQGHQGHQGARGYQGTQGLTGPQGAQGVQGTQGSQGTQGTQGLTGSQGSQGIQGFQGTQGVQGATGSQGNQGLIGTQGNQGVQGTPSPLPFPILEFDWDTAPVGSTGTIGSPSGAAFNEINEIVISSTDKLEEDLTLFLQMHLVANARLNIVSTNDQTRWAVYQIDSATLDTSPSRWSVGVTFLASNGDLFPDVHSVRVFLTSYTAIGGIGPQGHQGNDGPQGTQGVQGVTGATGAQGAQGATGSTGPQGLQGVQGVWASSDFTWQLQSSMSSGFMTVNSGTPSSVTTISLHYNAATGENISAWTKNVGVGSKVFIKRQSSPTQNAVYTITSITDNTTYVTYTVTFLSAVSFTFNNGVTYQIGFAFRGAQGVQGVQGSQSGRVAEVLYVSRQEARSDGGSALEFQLFSQTGNSPFVKLRVKYLHRTGIAYIRFYGMMARSGLPESDGEANLSMEIVGVSSVNALVTSTTYVQTSLELSTSGLVDGILYTVQLALWSGNTLTTALMKEIIIVAETT